MVQARQWHVSFNKNKNKQTFWSLSLGQEMVAAILNLTFHFYAKLLLRKRNQDKCIRCTTVSFLFNVRQFNIYHLPVQTNAKFYPLALIHKVNNRRLVELSSCRFSKLRSRSPGARGKSQWRQRRNSAEARTYLYKMEMIAFCPIWSYSCCQEWTWMRRNTSCSVVLRQSCKHKSEIVIRS